MIVEYLLTLNVICIFGCWTYLKAFEVSAGIQMPFYKRLTASLLWFTGPYFIPGLVAIAAELKKLEDEDND